MSVINFTVEYDVLAATQDSDDPGADADLLALIGEVDFTAQFSDLKAIQAPTYSPRPTGFKLLKFTGYLDGGRLKSQRGGTVGVRLPANDPVFGLDRLVYKVDFRLTTPGGQPVRVESGYLEAPSTDITLNLSTELANTGSPASPVNRIAPGAVRFEDGDVVFSFGGVDIPNRIPFAEQVAAVVSAAEEAAEVAVAAEIAQLNIVIGPVDGGDLDSNDEFPMAFPILLVSEGS